MKTGCCLALPPRPGPSRALRLAAIVLAATCLTPLARVEAQSCSTSGGTYTCTIPAGTHGSGLSVNVPTDNDGNALQANVTTQGAVTVTVPVNQGPALEVKAAGSNGSNGGNAQGSTITTQADLTLTNTTWSGEFVFGLYASLYGGNGASGSGSSQGGSGGNAAGTLSLSNSGVITLDAPSATVGSGAALYAITQGGQGGSSDKGGGGTGGQASGATVNNSGAIKVTVGGAKGFAGIAALGFGGNAGTTGSDGAGTYGGAGGPNSVTNSGAVTVDWSWKNTSTPNYGLFGIVAQSTGGNGSQSNKTEANGGAAGFNPSGAVHSASVNLTAGGDVTVSATGWSAGYAFPTGKNTGLNGAGVAAVLIGGRGGDLYAEGASAGSGGWAGTAPGVVSGQINVQDANVAMIGGDSLPGLLVLGQAGAGGNGLPQQQVDPNNRDTAGGDGGFAGDSQIQVSALTKAVTISTTGTNSPAIVNMLQGGAGGAGGFYSNTLRFRDAGNGGNGGAAGDVQVTLTGKSGAAINLITKSDQSAGIVAISQGGIGGAGGELSTAAGGGSGGTGGTGGHSWNVTVSLASTSISTIGTNSPGIFAQSIGAAGGAGGVEVGGTVSDGGPGGNGGYSKDVAVTLDSASSITTTGAGSSGIVAQTLSGAGGIGGSAAAIFSATGGNGGAGGASGNIAISNAGSIKTSGDSARGIVALTMTGVGGTGGTTYGITYDSGGSGASGGNVGTVSIANSGSIATAGKGAQGILAQSIAGGGGAGGDASGTVVSIGGNASTNPFAVAGNTVGITHSAGSITTTGASAVGILGQSIGGGGGDSGSVTDGTISIGGTGGAGGAGGNVAGQVNGRIAASGDGAHGMVMQSIGGGGGNGGNATADSAFVTYTIGGTGGSGGNGGPASLNATNATIITQGSKADGFIVQSIGGGGGSGGQAFSGSIGAGFSAAVAVGGSGGSGGAASQVSSQMVGGSIATGQNPLLTEGGKGSSGLCTSLPCNQLPVDAYGVVVQSIGGGGGVGGSSAAKALAVSVPVSEEGAQIAVAASVALGGKGGSGGNANYATFAASKGGQITTSGQGSTAVLLQSIGGGGGAGGDSSANSMAVGYGFGKLPGAQGLGVTTAVTVGGQGGSGGSGGPVYTALGGLISVANGSPVFTADPSGSPTSTITTYGDYANGIKAQSIGGGGGDAGHGSGNTQSFGTGSTSISVGVNLGATGGGGGSGGAVVAKLFPTSTITTWGSNAIGVVAQSIGGGGGASQGGSVSVGGSAKGVRGTFKVQIGTQGPSGGTGGDVTTDVQGLIQTHGGDAVGVLAQSIGGGGGLGGSAGSDASADNPIVAALNVRQGLSNIANGSAPWDGTFTVAIGGSGGSGNTGGAVGVNLSGNSAIFTDGDWASGIVAQSIGGGGGKGGTAAATGTGGRADITINFNLAVGGTGGTGGNSGPVTVGLTGSTFSTKGYGASAIIGQSIGGGGGMAADGSDGAWGLLAAGLASSGGGGAAGNGGNVTLNAANLNSIATAGEAAHAVLLQSVGGGGGFAGAGSSIGISVVRQALPSISLGAGGGPGASGEGGKVVFNDQGTVAITTRGNNAFGVLAQSVGGGGGIVSLSQVATTHAVAQNSLTAQIGGTSGEPNNNGNQVMVTLNAGSSITTAGTGAHGIVAQSIGGGGGIVGLPGTAPLLTTTVPSGQQASNGNGNTVSVTNGATIAVSGAGAIGILAQSIGSGGGLLLETNGNTVFAGSSGASVQGSGGHGNQVTVNTTGSVTASGANGIGIFAQSTGATVSEDGPITVTVDAAVKGGSGKGMAVQIDGPAGGRDGTVTVGPNGSLEAASGIAILASGGGAVNVTNHGTIIGQVDLGGGHMDNAGTYSPGGILRHDVVNTGLVLIRGNGTVANNTVTTHSGGTTAFLDAASGGLGRFITNAGGTFDISLLSAAGTTAGSIEGAGAYNLGSKQLTVGANNLSTTLSGVIADGGLGGGSGGSLVKLGAGTLNLTGNNTYTGLTTVAAGTLLVNGSLVSSVSLINGMLGGSGVIGGLAVTGGVLAPGNSIGTLTVNGNFSQSGGTYQPEVNSLGQSDRVNVTGSAAIGGGATVQVMPQSGGIYQRNTTYTLLTAQGGVSGAYSGASVGNGFAFMKPVLSYDANDVYVTLQSAFAQGAQTPNQYAVGAALDRGTSSATGDFASVLNALFSLSGPQGPQALNAISGQPIANFGTVNVQGASLFMNSLGQQMSLARGGAAGGGQRQALAQACEIAACDAASPFSVWGSLLGGLGSVQGSGNASTLTYNFGGAAAGIDYRIDPRFVVGIGAGYTHGTQWVNNFMGQGWSDSVSVAAYGSFTQAGFYADALAGYAHYSNQLQRGIVIPGLQPRTASGTTGANQFLGQVETGYRIGIYAPAQATLTPFARLQGSTVSQNGFNEFGAQSLSLNVQQQTTNSLRTLFGADLAGTIGFGNQRQLDLGLRLGWQHEYANTARPITAAFAGAPFAAFTAYGATPQRDAAVIGFSAKTKIADSTQLYLRYDGELNSGADYHALNVGVRFSW
jgi:uncharacterized protein YhjY with autotransporter beta-barrel domain